jgi:hypothetical protein
MTTHDVPVDVIATPTRVVHCGRTLPRPRGIDWRALSEAQIVAMPAIAARRRARWLAGTSLAFRSSLVTRRKRSRRKPKGRISMDEQTTRAQESARQTQEAARRAQQQQHQRARESTTEATRVASQLASLGTEAFAVWADVTQNAMRNMFELSSHTIQEGARQMAEWQRTNMDLAREMQAASFRWTTAVLPEALPIRWYQRSVEESIDATQRLVELGRRNAESMMQGYQRLGSVTEDTTKTLGETFREAATKMQDVYARSDRLRAA